MRMREIRKTNSSLEIVWSFRENIYTHANGIVMEVSSLFKLFQSKSRGKCTYTDDIFRSNGSGKLGGAGRESHPNVFQLKNPRRDETDIDFFNMLHK